MGPRLRGDDVFMGIDRLDTVHPRQFLKPLRHPAVHANFNLPSHRFSDVSFSKTSL
jgi:hypothetical protein